MKTKVRNGFQLDDGATIICRQLPDGWWEAWIANPESDSQAKTYPIFREPTRFKAQCKVARWYAERKLEFENCA